MENRKNVFMKLCQNFSDELEKQTFKTGVEEVQFIYAVITAFTVDALKHLKEKVGDLASMDDLLIDFLDDVQQELGKEK